MRQECRQKEFAQMYLELERNLNMCSCVVDSAVKSAVLLLTYPMTSLNLSLPYIRKDTLLLILSYAIDNSNAYENV